MSEINLSKEKCRQFALDIFDALIQEIKAWEVREQEAAKTNGNSECEKNNEEGRAA